MSDRLSEIEERLQRVEDAVRALAHAPVAGVHASEPADPAAALVSTDVRLDSTTLLTMSGRTVMVLGGAYALRALTESGRLPATAGVVLGIAYALSWLGVADRASSRRPLSGSFHGLAAILIGLPLLWEASAHFALLSARSSAIGLAGLAGVALGVAAHRRLQPLAAVTVLGSIAASVAFIARTHEPLPFALDLILLGGATLWVAESRGWWWIRWPAAIAADLVLVGLIPRAMTPIPLDRPSLVIALQLLLASVYAGRTAWRTLYGHEALRPFDVCQVPLSLLAGLGGALLVAGGQPTPVHGVLVAIMLALAGGCYLAAFAILRPRSDSDALFNSYATLALVLCLTGVAAATAAWARPVSVAVLAMVATGVAHRRRNSILALHGAAFGLAAAVWSGLLTTSILIWVNPEPWAPMTGAQALALIATGACSAVPAVARARAPQKPPGLVARAARLVLIVGLLTVLGALAVRGITWAMGGRTDSVTLATVRTLTLSGAAIALAYLKRSDRFVEFGSMVYPVLVLGALKLVVDDLPHSTPGALVIAFGAYGAALVLAPRIARRA